jgi:hypothetical protein
MKVTIHNVETGEIITREANTEELEQARVDAEAEVLRISEQKAKSDAKVALLERLGITEDEAKLLLG